MTVACHDGSPLVNFYCPDCGSISHVHETQLAGAPDDADVGGRCSNCGRTVVLDRARVDTALAESRNLLTRPLHVQPR